MTERAISPSKSNQSEVILMAAQDVVRTSASYRFLRAGGRAFLDISRGWFAPAAEPPLRRGLALRTYPAQVIWGARDPVLRAVLQQDLPPELSAGIASFSPEPAA